MPLESPLPLPPLLIIKLIASRRHGVNAVGTTVLVYALRNPAATDKKSRGFGLAEQPSGPIRCDDPGKRSQRRTGYQRRTD
jgi:hypothetical protein